MPNFRVSLRSRELLRVCVTNELDLVVEADNEEQARAFVERLIEEGDDLLYDYDWAEEEGDITGSDILDGPEVTDVAPTDDAHPDLVAEEEPAA